jgi:4-aminobutyrate aminotransferase-like enzyme
VFKDFKGISKSELASKVSENCLHKGLLVVHTGRESIKLGPPLIIEDQALVEAIGVIEDSINDVHY